MIHPIKSIKFRIQARIIENFENTRYAKRLRELKDIHKGERCFIVANGPSLRKEDLDLLQSKNEITFGMNRIFKMFDNTIWRPTYYVCEDLLIFNDCIDDINSIPAKMKFIPINRYFDNGINIDGALYFKPNYDREKDMPGSFSMDISKQMDSLGTVTFTCINIAAYMGFSEIYLLGVDHNFNVIINEQGETVVDNTVKNYFCENYDKDIQSEVVHNIGQTTKTYRKARIACDKLGIKVYNATRGGKLEEFIRVNFDDIFKTC